MSLKLKEPKGFHQNMMTTGNVVFMDYYGDKHCNIASKSTCLLCTLPGYIMITLFQHL